jgi:hypothetical protein
MDVWTIGIYDPEDEWDVRIVNDTSTPSKRPSATAILGDGYVLTGGGAWVHWNGPGNVLTASYPESKRWIAASKAPDDNEECRISAYAIGLRHREGTVRLRTKSFKREGVLHNRPIAEVAVEAPYTLVGGGAGVTKYTKGNYLTASYPDFKNGKWIANSKDHLAGNDNTTIVAYSIGLQIIR